MRTPISLCFSRFMLMALVWIVSSGCNAPSPSTAPGSTATPQTVPAAPPPKDYSEPGLTQTASGLRYKDLVVGRGSEAQSERKVTVNYVGRLTNGVEIDSSQARKKPYSFIMGFGEVIPGWEQGITGMRVGGKRRLVIPPTMAFGTAATPDHLIPENATVIYDIELTKVE